MKKLRGRIKLEKLLLISTHGKFLFPFIRHVKHKSKQQHEEQYSMKMYVRCMRFPSVLPFSPSLQYFLISTKYLPEEIYSHI